MSEIEKLLGSELCSQEGARIKTASICGKGKVLGLYFSAHWCPPCRQFTPKLAEFYTAVKSTKNGENFDIVFVSSDRDEKSYEEYFSEHPWKSLIYEDRERKGSLSGKFKVSGIPTLVFIDAVTGKLVNKDGRSIVTEDPKGENFPWKEKTFSEMFQGELLKNHSGEKTTVEEATKGNIVGLYFSAHWCPPCKAFTPVLKETYNTLKEQGKNIEIIFMSSDRTVASFTEYYGEMPWLAVPFNDARVKDLSRHFEVEGIPTLVFLDKDHDVITKNGRGAISSDKKGEKFPWIPESLAPLTADGVSAVNESASLIFLTGGTPDVIDLAKECMLEIATEHVQKSRDRKKKGEDVDDDILYFFEAEDDSDDTAESLRNYLNLEDRSPLVIFLDIPNGKKFVLPEGEKPTKERLQTILTEYAEKKLNMVELRA